jgi:hypothetical protein
VFGIATTGSHPDPLQIRQPASFVLIVGMTYIVAGGRPFAANFTFFCHDQTPYHTPLLAIAGIVEIP